jgi:hypothetical protein
VREHGELGEHAELPASSSFKKNPAYYEIYENPSISWLTEIVPMDLMPTEIVKTFLAFEFSPRIQRRVDSILQPMKFMKIK